MARTCPDGTWRRVTLLIRMTKMVHNVPNGFVELVGLKVYVPFCGTAQLIKVIDLIVSKMARVSPPFKPDCARAIMGTDNTKSWYAPTTAAPSSLARKTHNFVIHILNLQHGSWQGEFIWLRKLGHRMYFRSALEMSTLIVSASTLARKSKAPSQN